MASNDPAPKEVPLPDTGAVAFLTRIVRLPARTDQTPLRAVYLVIIAAMLGLAPVPFSVIGFIAVVALALSLGRITT
jgi:hypothetical protein